MDELGKLSDEDVADHIRSKDSEAFLEIMNRYQEKKIDRRNYFSIKAFSCSFKKEASSTARILPE